MDNKNYEITRLQHLLKQKEDEIQKLQENIYNLNNIISLMPGHVYWKDRKGKYLGSNELQAKNLGFSSAKELIGKTDYELPWREQAQALEQIDQEVIATQKSHTVEETVVLPDGQEAIFLSKKVPLFSSQNQIIGILGISFDITDRKLAEEREKLAIAESTEAKVKAKAETELRQAVMVLSGSIAHDLRSPIGIIEMKGKELVNYLPTLIEAYHQAKAAKLSFKDELPRLEIQRTWALEALNEMGPGLMTEARRMHNIIDVTLKTLSQVLKGELKQKDLVKCSIWECINEVLTRYPFADNERQLVHEQELNQKYQFDFMGNEVLMFRILSNLLKNSLEQIRKNQHGEIFITTEDGGDVNMLRFKDTAGGAPPEVVVHIFEGYRTTKEQGTGVGLAFCKLTMKSFGGDVSCSSVYGDYIEFVLTFPKL